LKRAVAANATTIVENANIRRPSGTRRWYWWTNRQSLIQGRHANLKVAELGEFFLIVVRLILLVF
jgi:hypothetical protein